MVTRKQQIGLLLRSIETRYFAPAFYYIDPERFVQHNLNLADGVEGMKNFLSEVSEGTMVHIKRLFRDGNYIFAHSEFNFNGPKVGFNIFRYEKNKIVEHWDNLQPIQPLNPSGRSMMDGATQIKDLYLTEVNKAIARDFIEDIFITHRLDRLPEFIDGDNLIQHSPYFPDSVSALLRILSEWTEEGKGIRYNTIHEIVGEGNFALVISEGTIHGVHSAFYNLFRMEEEMIVEHWDVIEPIPSKETWKNNNGKF